MRIENGSWWLVGVVDDGNSLQKLMVPLRCAPGYDAASTQPIILGAHLGAHFRPKLSGAQRKREPRPTNSGPSRGIGISSSLTETTGQEGASGGGFLDSRH